MYKVTVRDVFPSKSVMYHSSVESPTRKMLDNLSIIARSTHSKQYILYQRFSTFHLSVLMSLLSNMKRYKNHMHLRFM